MPGSAALTGDYAPQRLRATMIMATFTGAPLGGFLCGQIAGRAAAGFGWPGIFLVGGVVPLVMVAGPGAVAAGIAALPGAARAAVAPPGGAVAAASASPRRRRAGRVDLAGANPIAMLFGKGYALQTVLLWIIFFCSLMNLFLFAYWLPQVLHLTGLTPAEAARATSFRDLGAIFAVLYLGILIDRSGPERALAWHYAAGIVFIGADRPVRDAVPAAGRDDLLRRHGDHRQPDRR